MEGPSGPDRALAACVHRRDLGEDQHGAPARLGNEGTTAEGLCAPHGHWKTLTFIAALRHDRFDAPWVTDGPINGETFLLYIEAILAPSLSSGDVVVLDNLGSHKGKAARAILRAKGAHLIFLPPYSPDLNPIEQVFAKLKHLLRKAQPRDVEATWRKVGQLIDLFSPAECANYLVNSGYGSV
jgi:transposase